MQHIDEPDPERGWTNPPHRSHLCAGCELTWRPADVCTNGVAQTRTTGKNDTPMLPVIVLLRRGPQRSELHSLTVQDQQWINGISDHVRVGRERYAVYEAFPGRGSLLLVGGYGECNVVNGAWTLKRNDDGTAYREGSPEFSARLIGYVEDQMEYAGAFGGSDSEDTPHYKELLQAFVDGMTRRART
jgi:hypothetical protein